MDDAIHKIRAAMNLVDEARVNLNNNIINNNLTPSYTWDEIDRLKNAFELLDEAAYDLSFFR